MRASLAWCVLVVACSGTPPSIDAGLDAGSDDDGGVRPPRGETDGGVESFYARECSSTADCDGEFCDLDYPRGMCEPACAVHEDCPPGGGCINRRCRPRCMPGANDCRGDMFCDPALGFCFASCSARPDAGIQRCRYVGDACQASWCESAHLPAGLAIGEPCTADAQCAFRACLTARGLGWPGGMCVQLMRAPGAAAWSDPGRLPSGGCVDAHAVFPLTGSQGDLAACVPRCTADGDCRDGYRCDRQVLFDGPEHTDGACVPWLCGGPLDRPCSGDRACMPFDGSLSACFAVP